MRELCQCEPFYELMTIRILEQNAEKDWHLLNRCIFLQFDSVANQNTAVCVNINDIFPKNGLLTGGKRLRGGSAIDIQGSAM